MMQELKAGMKIIHKQRAIELIFLAYDGHNRQCWKVKILFVEPATEDYEWIMKGLAVKELHTHVGGSAIA